MQGAHEVGGSAAVPATDFQHPVVGEVDLGCRAVVELNEEPVGLVGRLQRQGHRRIFLVARVEEHQIITAEAGGEGIKALRQELRGFCGPTQAAPEAHQWSITGCAEQFAALYDRYPEITGRGPPHHPRRAICHPSPRDRHPDDQTRRKRCGRR